jgi:uncharacterized metal-binding protein
MHCDQSAAIRCTHCGVLACSEAPGVKEPPEFCPAKNSPEILEQVSKLYREDAETRELAAAAARTEAGGYCRDTRIEEIMAFARRIGAHHLGIACCVGLRREAAAAQDVFENAGFQVSTVICKVGSIPKEDIGLKDEEKIRPGGFEALCNPVAQARLLEHAGTQLNVLIGLCVGHDSLFFKHSAAPVTVLVAKDRVLGHNPVAALYTLPSYYRRLKQPASDSD